jgi:hypothetical protein
MKQFILCLQSEVYKSKRTMALTGTILMPLTISTVAFLIFYFRSDVFAGMGTNPWILLANNVFGPLTAMLLPFYVIIISFANHNLETKADAWKNLFALPLPKQTVYTSKFIFTLLLILFSLFLLCLFVFATGNLLAAVKPELRFHDYDSSKLIISFFVKLFLAIIGLYAVQTFINVYYNDFIKSIGLGFLFVIIGFMIAGWGKGYIFPFALPGKITRQFFEKDVTLMNREIASSLLWGVFFFVIGFWRIKKQAA